jgi:hypothetical protein
LELAPSPPRCLSPLRTGMMGLSVAYLEKMSFDI